MGRGGGASKYRPRVDWVMRQKILSTAPAGPTAKRSQATAVIGGKAYRFADRELARRAPQYDLSKDEREVAVM